MTGPSIVGTDPDEDQVDEEFVRLMGRFEVASARLHEHLLARPGAFTMAQLEGICAMVEGLRRMAEGKPAEEIEL